MTKNKELREAAVRAVTNYLHQELYDEHEMPEMIEFMRQQAEKLIDGADRAIELTKMFKG